MLTLRWQPLGVSSITAWQNYVLVWSNGCFQRRGGPRARGDLGYPPAIQIFSAGSPFVWQDDAKLLHDLEERYVTSGVPLSLPETVEALSKDLPGLGANAV